MSDHKVWFITGASSGFGRALAEAVLTEGDSAAIAARRSTELEELANQYPDTALPITLDVTDAAAREAAVQQVLKRFQRIDVLANVAGRGSLGAAEEFSAAQLRDQMDINFFAAAELTKAVLPTMRSQKSGNILQLTSIGGVAAFQGFAPYCASKFALEGWSEALDAEVRGLGIKVTIVEPGAFRTEFAGAKNMRPDNQIADYRPIIEPIEQYLYGSDGKQPGDPAKAAQAMIRVVESENPPLHLLLGDDAADLWEKKLAKVQTEATAWHSVTSGTAFEGAVAGPVGG